MRPLPNWSGSLPIIEGASGLTSLTTWVVHVREDWQFLDAALARRATDETRILNLCITLEHEVVHFLQGLTTAFTYSFSLSLFSLFSYLQTYSRGSALSPANLKEFKQAYDNYWRQFDRASRGITTRHLLEATAVTESYRALAATPTSEGFRRFIDTYFPAPNDVYRGAIEAVGKIFGEAAALDLTPKLSFLALNGDDPAANFWYFVDKLSGIPGAGQLTTQEICDRSGIRETELLSLNYERLPASQVHPLLKPYIELLRRVPGESKLALLEILAMPGNRARAQGLENTFARLLPAYIACSGGRAEILGVAKEWAREEVMAFMAATAICGACERLLTTKRPYQACIHANCPMHAGALCHAMYPPSSALNWSECLFPTIVENVFGATGQSLMERRAEAGVVDSGK